MQTEFETKKRADRLIRLTALADVGQTAGHAVRILRFSDVTKKTGLSRGAIAQRLKKCEFPTPINLGGGRAVGFIENEVNEWIEKLVRDSRSGGAK
jgi:prophage regulatory protein